MPDQEAKQAAQEERELRNEKASDKDWNYFKRVEAHRTYLYAMSMYKHLRYGKTKTKNFSKNS